MKKGEIYEGVVERIDFPNKGRVHVEGETVTVKNAIPGQKIRFQINKKRKNRMEGRLLEVTEKSPMEKRDPVCSIFPSCGGCMYQTMSYEDQLAMKAGQVKKLLDDALVEAGQVNEAGEADYPFLGIKGSPKEFAYRNKMEFSFGDEYKDGPLSLGLHKKGSTYDVLTACDCKIVHEDFTKILTCVLAYFKERNASYYHKISHEGYLRHLLVRRAENTGEILVNLVTTSQEEWDLMPLVQEVLGLPLEGKVVGFLHIINDSLADIVKSDETKVLYGQDYFYEELLGLKFKITPFSFFQTNSLGAEVLYSTAREFVGETKDRTIFDLYSGTGTIAQILAPVAKEVIGVEIVEEAVTAAKENAEANGLTNCSFLAGDVLKVIDQGADDSVNAVNIKKFVGRLHRCTHNDRYPRSDFDTVTSPYPGSAAAQRSDPCPASADSGTAPYRRAERRGHQEDARRKGLCSDLAAAVREHCKIRQGDHPDRVSLYGRGPLHHEPQSYPEIRQPKTASVRLPVSLRRRTGEEDLRRTAAH